jgi:hypothetical protein
VKTIDLVVSQAVCDRRQHLRAPPWTNLCTGG